MASIQINNIPSDTYKFILKLQGEKKAEKGCAQYSQERTVLAMLEDYRKIKESQKK